MCTKMVPARLGEGQHVSVMKSLIRKFHAFDKCTTLLPRFNAIKIYHRNHIIPTSRRLACCRGARCGHGGRCFAWADGLQPVQDHGTGMVRGSRMLHGKG